jgi:hypothetical protein
MNGFLCACSAEFPAGSAVDVYLTNGKEAYVGKAKIEVANALDASVWHYGCRFTEKVGPWVLL